MKQLCLVLAFLLLLLCGCAATEAELQQAYDKGYDAGLVQGKAIIDQLQPRFIGEAYDSGYSAGHKEAVEQCDLCLRKPTYKEVMDFIKEDGTDQMMLANCLTRAERLNNEAMRRGIWCYVVLFNYYTGTCYGFHAIVAFDTVDRGLIYVEPQTDCEVKCDIGVEYSEQLCQGGKVCPLTKMFIRQIGVIK